VATWKTKKKMGKITLRRDLREIRRLWSWEGDGTGSGSCLIAGVVIRDVEFSGSTIRELGK
jgi:hypothetical protein